MIQRNLRGKGLTMMAFNKGFKPPAKPNSSLKISHLHKNQTKILTTNSKIWEGKMTIYDMLFLFSATEGRVCQEELEYFQPHNREKTKRTQLPAYHSL